MNQTDPRVDGFLDKTSIWKEELTLLRQVLLETDLIEEFKWYQPCYTYDNSNVVILAGFKAYFAVSFFKGALLKDDHKVLVKPGDNTQSARVIKMTSVEDVSRLAPMIKEYVKEAMKNEKSGLKVVFESKSESDYPLELQNRFNELPELKIAFEKLTPGRQNAYLLYFNGAKQSATKKSRIEKYESKILEGLGFYD